MNKLFKFLIYSLILFSIIVSCKDKEITNDIYYDMSFDQIAQIAESNQSCFCIVLIDSTEFSAQNFINRSLLTSPDLKVVYNFINTSLPKNKWYSKILLPEIYPISCIFSETQNLIDIIPGTSKESFRYIEKSIIEGSPNTDYPYNRLYYSEKLSYLNYADKALKLYFDLYNTDTAPSFIDTIYSISKNPYIKYLKSQFLLNQKDTIKAIDAAKEFLSCDSAIYYMAFHEEIMKANCLINPDYTWENAPSLDIIPRQISIDNCHVLKPQLLSFSITNNGNYPLKIASVFPSCSCIRVINVPKIIAAHGKATLTATLEVDTNIENDIEREIYIISNDKTNPLSTISVNAHN